MTDLSLEQLAALHALGLLDENELKRLMSAAEKDPAVRRMMADFAESAAVLAYDDPQAVPPPASRRELMRQLPVRPTAPARKVLTFPQILPYALAACLIGLAVYQADRISHLRGQVHSTRGQVVALEQRNSMTELRLASLQAKDAAYSSAKVMVAWNPKMHKGMISMEDMPAPPAGHDYQLWALDPGSAKPVSLGVLTPHSTSEGFAVRPASTDGLGFAISLEPSGGRPSPTGAILFAVAPGR